MKYKPKILKHYYVTESDFVYRQPLWKCKYTKKVEEYKIKIYICRHSGCNTHLKLYTSEKETFYKITNLSHNCELKKRIDYETRLNQEIALLMLREDRPTTEEMFNILRVEYPALTIEYLAYTKKRFKGKKFCEDF